MNANAARKSTPATTAKKGSTVSKPAKAAKTAAPKVEKAKKSDQREEDRDWTYLADKAPTDLHEDMAAFILEKTGLEVEDKDAFIKAVQLTAVMRMVYQRSDANKTRSTYRGLAEEVVEQRSTHMIQAHQDAKAEIAERLARDEAKAAARKEAAKKAAAARKAKKAGTAPTPSPEG